MRNIDVEGNAWFRSAYLRDRVARGVSTPLNIHPLQERIQLLQQRPRIERINAELKPGDVRGESVLNVRWKDANPFGPGWSPQLSNPDGGAERGLATVAHQNVTGHGDQFMFTHGRLCMASIPSSIRPIAYRSTGMRRRHCLLSTQCLSRRRKLFSRPDLNVDSQVTGSICDSRSIEPSLMSSAPTLTGEHLF